MFLNSESLVNFITIEWWYIISNEVYQKRTKIFLSSEKNKELFLLCVQETLIHLES